jgi:hypothetical protein
MASPGRRTIKGLTAKFAKKYRKGRKTDNRPFLVLHHSGGHLLRGFTASDFLGHDQLPGFNPYFRQVEEE